MNIAIDIVRDEQAMRALTLLLRALEARHDGPPSVEWTVDQDMYVTANVEHPIVDGYAEYKVAQVKIAVEH